MEMQLDTPVSIREIVKEDTSEDSTGFLKTLSCSPLVLHMVLILHGMAQIFSSHAITNSSHFFIERVSNSNQGHVIMDYLFVILTTVRFAFLIFSSYAFDWRSPLKNVVRTQVWKGVILLCFAGLVYMHNVGPMLFLMITLTLVFAMSVCQVISFFGIFKFMHKIPKTFMYAYSSGQGVASILAAAFKLATIYFASTGHTQEGGLMFYFLFSSFTLFVGAFLLILAFKFRFPEENSSKDGELYCPLDQHHNTSPNCIYNEREEHIYDKSSFTSSSLENIKDDSMEIKLEDLYIEEAGKEIETPFVYLKPHRTTFRDKMKKYYSVYKEIRFYMFCILIGHIQVIFLVPNFLYMVEPTGEHGKSKLFSREIYPVLTLLVFATGEYLGKVPLGRNRYTLKKKTHLAILTAFSTLYIPFFLLSNVHILNTEYPIPRYLASDNLFVSIVFTYGILVGYLSTNMIFNTQYAVQQDEDRTYVSNLVIYCISLGLLIGAYTSLFLKIYLNHR